MRRRRPGFTLIELLVVIAIIAILIALAAPGRPGGTRGGAAGPVHQQPQAIRPGPAQLRERARRACPSARATTTWTRSPTRRVRAVVVPQPAPGLHGADAAVQRDQLQPAARDALGWTRTAWASIRRSRTRTGRTARSRGSRSRRSSARRTRRTGRPERLGQPATITTVNEGVWLCDCCEQTPADGSGPSACPGARLYNTELHRPGRHDRRHQQHRVLQRATPRPGHARPQERHVHDEQRHDDRPDLAAVQHLDMSMAMPLTNWMGAPGPSAT